MLKSVTDTINTSFLIKTENHLLVIDGGFASEAENLAENIRELGGKVDCWFLTHIHDDHVGAAAHIMENCPDITVKAVCRNFPSAEFVDRWEPQQGDKTSTYWLARVDEMAEKAGAELITPVRGDTFTFDELFLRVLYIPDESKAHNINDTSMVFRMEINGKSLLFMGDLGAAGGYRMLEDIPNDELASDYVQMSHHGQHGVTLEVYAAVKPSYCFWCTPTWLWDNMGPGGYDTGNFQTVIVRGWISSLHCVKQHYLMQKGPFTIEL